MTKKRIINRGPFIKNGGAVGAGKPFKMMKDAQGNKDYRTSVLAQRAPSPIIKKQIASKQVTKTTNPKVVAKMSFKASAKFQQPMKANAKVNIRAKGVQKMQQKIAKTTPTKAKTVTKKPPSKGR